MNKIMQIQYYIYYKVSVAKNHLLHLNKSLNFILLPKSGSEKTLSCKFLFKTSLHYGTSGLLIYLIQIAI